MKKLNLENAFILDTETTGLDSKSQIVELTAICANSGELIYSSLVRPQGFIPAEATRIHGITNSDVADAPTFLDIIYPLSLALRNRTGIIYNADFDSRMFIQSYERNLQISHLDLRSTYFALKHKLLNSQCAMNWYAEFWGEFDATNGGYRWQRLTNACKQQNIDVSDLTAHRALADCEMTRRLINAVNGQLA
ncbi:3'-5' exonuclease [Vibrio cholerae]|uniref:3'-5' exonuclease n=1 Tax=Vibrio cholerae TaxID=666 RepID=UPI0004D9338C|nr:3'-5' exonuclease [Vibrio cholerae]KEH06047.1 DNA polymerase III subunit epsilon [Vibrio cholerae 2012EL-1759]NOE72214.1 3'-5' exonuclease [Vibrio cholerae]NOE88367.1 3'-5' exonuclease [Vibrio cholerae]NOE90986.1 3'-5' exonuclease [Vibrio cholerae]NOF97623.1 3'-5' exonuclease [Vibrio cholerae]